MQPEETMKRKPSREEVAAKWLKDAGEYGWNCGVYGKNLCVSRKETADA